MKPAATRRRLAAALPASQQLNGNPRGDLSEQERVARMIGDFVRMLEAEAARKDEYEWSHG
eukprot:15481799-Alexandrium_andersonii.AAC.1